MPLLIGVNKELNSKLSEAYNNLAAIMTMASIGNPEVPIMALITAADELHKSLLADKQERIWNLEHVLTEERQIWGTEIHLLADKVMKLRKLVGVQQGGDPISKEMSSKVSKS